ncbi:hypothetical protein BHX94_11125 [Macrococcoides bohemicum]|uniref:Gram-positive cocci surface proteins LPxTG domain-containing protein n=1 Tax=Macrococcoides bohemicum TaxID=1903056 RepID=A0A328A281_9STAP|nr:hypothetical protein BHX94_11125 [Macrococcus bohemicus]
MGSEDVDSDGPVDVLVDINGANITTLDTGFIPLNGQGSKPVQGGEATPAPAPGNGGEVKPAPSQGNLSIGDHVWWDANRNNLYDQGENPVAGLRVSIRDYAGNFIAETTTDANGNYAFHGLSDGQYIVNFHNPLDWSPVIANIDNDVSEAIDSDGPTDVIVNLKGASNYNVDQGYYGVGTPAPGETVKPAEIGKTVLPDKGEKDNGGAVASVLALLGGAALFGSRRK